jgi:hypothetical protein
MINRESRDATGGPRRRFPPCSYLTCKDEGRYLMTWHRPDGTDYSRRACERHQGAVGQEVERAREADARRRR